MTFKLPKSTQKLQIKYPASFNCFAETRCYSANPFNTCLSNLSEEYFQELEAYAKEHNHRYVCEITDIVTGLILTLTCNDARRPAHRICMGEGPEVLERSVCILWEV